MPLPLGSLSKCKSSLDSPKRKVRRAVKAEPHLKPEMLCGYCKCLENTWELNLGGQKYMDQNYSRKWYLQYKSSPKYGKSPKT